MTDPFALTPEWNPGRPATLGRPGGKGKKGAPPSKLDPAYRQVLLAPIIADMNGGERSAQTLIGPSQVGGCARKNMGQLLFPEAGGGGSYSAWKGTQLHEGLDRIFGRLPDTLPGGGKRWRVSTKLRQRSPHLHGGTLDVHDALMNVVIDWKCPGKNTVDSARRDDISLAYFIQLQTYGWHLEGMGEHVERVGIMYLPMASARIDDAVFRFWDYDATVAEASAGYLEHQAALASIPGINPEALLAIQPTQDSFCSDCPVFVAGRCSGHIDV